MNAADVEELAARITELAGERSPDRERSLPLITALLDALEHGSVRAAERGPDGWRSVDWVKRGILLGFRVGHNETQRIGNVFAFRDRDTFPTRDPAADGRDVRIVPGGSTVRRGAYLADGVVVMPPAYVNVGAWVGPGSMIDSHALVGSCAQVGEGVHLSAAAQIGGVLEPVGALPAIIEDGAFIGGGCGVYEGSRVGAGAVLAPGVVLTRAVPLIDVVRQREIRAEPGSALEVPAGAVVVPGNRRLTDAWSEQRGIGVAAPVIVKYRDAGTDAALALEESLR